MECFRLLLEHLVWIEHQFLSGIRDSRKAWSLWGMMRGVGGVRNSIHQSRLAKELGSSARDSEGIDQHSSNRLSGIHQDSTPVHNFILFHRLFDQDGYQDCSSPFYSPDLAPCDFWLFPKLRSCRYETIEEMKEAVTTVIDTLTQEDFHGAFQKFLERYNKCIAAGGDYFEGD